MMSSSVLAKDSFGIFWNGEEVQGMTCYAYYRKSDVFHDMFPIEKLPRDTEVKYSNLSGIDWLVRVWDLKIPTWPENWKSIVEQTLSIIVANGSLVAWFGFEGFFVDPPGLFDPSRMSHSVYAAYSRTTGFICHFDLCQPIIPLSDEEMLQLRSVIMNVK